MINSALIRQQFPQLKNKVHGKTLIYFDSAATSYKPQVVIDKVKHYYQDLSVNVHRAIHPLAEIATQEYESTRDKIMSWIGAKDRAEILFTKGTTESINLLANIVTEKIQPGDEIVLTISEHHSNLVPWQMLAKRTKAKLQFITLHPNGQLNLESAKKIINSKTKILSLPYISNVLGFINPVAEIIQLAKKFNTITVIDAAQAASRLSLDVQKLDVDFLALSAHKAFGPTGLGILYGKKALLETLPPFLGGGDMIEHVTLENTIYNQLPYKYEAGTPNIEAVIAFNAAINFINDIGQENIYQHELNLTQYLYEKLASLPDIDILGRDKGKLGVVSFNFKDIHSQDMAVFLGRRGFALRSGHLCAQPLLHHYGYTSVLRASLSIYNTEDEIDALIQAVSEVKKFLKDNS